MTNIIEEVQLDYCDVMIKPKRSTLNSRSEPDVYREYKFKWSGTTLYGNGLTVANMGTTGTFAMAEVMAKNLMFTCLHKHYPFEELKEFLEKHKDVIVDERYDEKDLMFLDYVFVSTGIKEGDYEKICKVLDLGLCKNLCIDIANGYIPKLLDFVKKIRNQYPDLRIMVGNVVTGDMVQDLILAGADMVKVGIGPGCFTGNMLIKTDKGIKPIKDIEENENVLTHTGEYHKVLNKFCYNHHKEIIKINDNNYQNYAKWVSAIDLNEKEHLLLEIK